MLARALLAGLILAAAPVHAAVDGPDATTPVPCVVKGTLAENATIYDLAKGGQPIVDIIGTQRWVHVSEFLPHAQRFRIVSGRSTPSLRVEGFVDAASMPIAAAKDISIAGHVLEIRATVPLRLAESNGVLLAEPRTPTFEGLETRVACGDLQITKEKAPPSLPPSGSLYVPSVQSIDLFGGPGGSPLMTLRAGPASSKLMLSGYENSNGYVHVRYAGDVLLDGWMRATDLSGKASIGIGCVGGMGGLGTWGTSAPPSYAQRDTEVRLGPQGSRVGVLEKGTRVAKWGTGSGVFIPIRIYDVDAHEPAGKSFYVREDDLGNAPP